MFGFSYQLDVGEGPYVAILETETLTRQWLDVDGVTNFVAMGSQVLVQSNADLLTASVLGGQVMRRDLDHLALAGFASGNAIASDSWNDRKLLALPLDELVP